MVAKGDIGRKVGRPELRSAAPRRPNSQTDSDSVVRLLMQRTPALDSPRSGQPPRSHVFNYSVSFPNHRPYTTPVLALSSIPSQAQEH